MYYWLEWFENVVTFPAQIGRCGILMAITVNGLGFGNRPPVELIQRIKTKSETRVSGKNVNCWGHAREGKVA